MDADPRRQQKGKLKSDCHVRKLETCIPEAHGQKNKLKWKFIVKITKRLHVNICEMQGNSEC